MIEAQNLLTKMKLADYPNMKNTDRERWVADISKQAFAYGKPTESLTTEELGAFLKAKIHG